MGDTGELPLSPRHFPRCGLWMGGGCGRKKKKKKSKRLGVRGPLQLLALTYGSPKPLSGTKGRVLCRRWATATLERRFHPPPTSSLSEVLIHPWEGKWRFFDDMRPYLSLRDFEGEVVHQLHRAPRITPTDRRSPALGPPLYALVIRVRCPSPVTVMNGSPSEKGRRDEEERRRRRGGKKRASSPTRRT